jgi:hypothetical protein
VWEDGRGDPSSYPILVFPDAGHAGLTCDRVGNIAHLLGKAPQPSAREFRMPGILLQRAGRDVSKE